LCAANHTAHVKLRLFVALEVDDAVRTLAQDCVASLRERGVQGRFEPAEKLHVTVAFLGSVDAAQCDAVAQTLRQTSELLEPFTLVFDTMGAFPNARRPRVLWLGPSAGSADFAECANRIRTAYAQLGFRFDHEASAHLTICRATSVPPGPLPRPRSSATLAVRGLTLMRSLPAGQTTRYEALERTTFPP
jgi:RNA 2',3'-cyclic 3'-phosphodiesterase